MIPAIEGERPRELMMLIAAQVICAAFFVADVIADLGESLTAGLSLHLSIEILATLSFVAAIGFEARFIRKLLRRKAHLERSVSIASSAMQDVLHAHFEAWGLTASEQDVANFMVKGMNIAEIAALRGSAEGTVKSHLNAIYRKSGTSGRGELLSTIIDGLLNGGDAAAPTPPPRPDDAAMAGPAPLRRRSREAVAPAPPRHGSRA